MPGDSADTSGKTLLAVDLGTGGPKVSVVTTTGRVLSTAFEPTDLIQTPDGGIEQDPEEWWRTITTASRRAVAEAPTDAQKPSAVAVTSQWVTTVPVDENADPLMNAVSWLDGRGGAYAHEAVGPAPRVFGYNPVKVLRWIRRTAGAPSLQGHDPVGQILMIADRYPDVYAKTRWFLEPGDFLTARMTGEILSAAETASGCWGVDIRDINNMHYDERLLKMAGLPAEKLAPIIPTNSLVGNLLPARAEELGVAAGIPVAASTPDNTSAAVGSGAIENGAMHYYIGTSGWVSGHVDFKRTDIFHSIATLPSSIPGRYLIAGEQQTCGRSLEHLRDHLLGTPERPMAELVAEAEASQPGAGGVVFTPWLNGERTPLDDPHVRGSYSNISLATDRADLVRATLEGVALNARWMMQCVEKLARTKVDDIALIGGGMQSDLWCQIISDVFDRNVRRIEQPRQANTRGAALLAAAALGEIAISDIPQLVKSDRSFSPDPANRALYDTRFKAFQGYYKSNRKFFRQLNDSK